jgi:lipopolysaccharide transport system ATP-binding protein
MSQPAISVERLSKLYRVGSPQARTDTFRDLIADIARRPFRRGHAGDKATQDFWALRDVSFEVKRGEAIGIIGRNGAGKSTLLKILSRITAPTSGRAVIRGRVASLLEVGTGFHPELTGRENVYMNGSILGMTKAEVDRKFDQIVEFADVGQFLDTPLKRYSSGMGVRLAFAVAAHLEPDILIVDEVLAVGDAQFQRKCLGQMERVSQRGRTVLFVSHNLAAIRSLCTSAVLLDRGNVVSHGPVNDVAAKYLAQTAGSINVPLRDRNDRLGNGKLRFTDVRLRAASGAVTDEILSGDPVTIEADYVVSEGIDHARLFMAMSLWDEHRNPAALFASDEMGATFGPMANTGTLRLEVPHLLLRGGSYSLKLMASHISPSADHFYDVVEDTITLLVMPGDYWGSGYTNRPGAYSVMPASLRNT